jgi:hypothetical protein
MSAAEPLNLELLDDEDPFEIDEANRPHLFSHETFGDDDLDDVWTSDPLFFRQGLRGVRTG